jgi:hypothetical protein
MIIGTFSGPPAPTGGSSSANEYSTIQELLYKMPDNTANLIQAKDVRDSVYTLWERISSVQTVASQSASASSYYTNLSPSVASNLAGIPAGSTFSNKSMQEMWDMLLYPYVGPVASLSGGFNREFGDSNALTLTWNATKNSKSITSIVVNGTPIVVTGNSQAGTQPATSTQNVNTSFTMTVSDIPNGSSTVTSTTTATWNNRRYWGTIPVGHPLTTVSALPFAHSNVSTLSNELGSGFAQTRTITTNFDYVVFIWPHNSVNLSTNPPRVSIGGFGNNNWIKTRSNVQFTNQFGYTGTNYDVWVFGNTQAPNTFTYVIS